MGKVVEREEPRAAAARSIMKNLPRRKRRRYLLVFDLSTYTDSTAMRAFRFDFAPVSLSSLRSSAFPR
jgi:hypothetical protein